MQEVATTVAQSEPQFAALVDTLASDPDRREQLTDLLREDHPLYHQLLSAFDALTGCPVIVNTSFNVRDEPLVCSPADAYRCFVRTEIDVVVLGPFVIEKAPGLVLPEPEAVPPDDLDEEDPHAARELPRRARQFGGLLTVLFGVLAVWSWRSGQPLRAEVQAAASALFLALVLGLPRALIPVFRLATSLTRRVSPFATAVLLGVCYLTIVTPVALLLRLRGKRPLGPAWREGRVSNWSPRKRVARTLERYRRSF